MRSIVARSITTTTNNEGTEKWNPDSVYKCSVLSVMFSKRDIITLLILHRNELSACVRACVCAWRSVVCMYVSCEQWIQYYIHILFFWRFYAYIFVHLVKLGVLTVVGEIRRHKNHRCYYYHV